MNEKMISQVRRSVFLLRFVAKMCIGLYVQYHLFCWWLTLEEMFGVLMMK